MDIIYKALADKQRRKILELLRASDMTVTEIAVHFDISGASLSHHLAVLKQARLVIAEREGQCMRYSLNTSVMEEIMKSVLSVLGKGK